MDDLIETLETIVEDAEWALAADWSLDNLKERIASLIAQARYAKDQALDLALIRDTHPRSEANQ